MGDYWHSNPIRYNKNSYSINDIQSKQLHRDKLKNSYISNNYHIPILYLWEIDINKRFDVCIRLINEYINKNKILPNYHSFNWDIIDGNLSLKQSIIIPYQDMSINEYRNLIKTSA